MACFGQPKRLITDGGSKLVGHVMKAYCAKNALQQIVTTPYHPKANGRVEQLNGSLVQLIAKLSQEHPNTAWTEHLPTTLLILQARINRGTGFSPSILAFGTPDSLMWVEQGKLWSTVPGNPP